MADVPAVEAPAILTVDEVAEYLRIPRGSVYKLAQNGKIPCQKVGKHWRFRREALDEWLSRGNSGEGR
jgi:excisionase family DNA binding protein